MSTVRYYDNSSMVEYNFFSQNEIQILVYKNLKSDYLVTENFIVHYIPPKS